MPKFRHDDHPGLARFVTFTCFRRRRLLSDVFTCQAVLAELSRLRSVHRIKIVGYVIMPEHIHVILIPPNDLPVGSVIGSMKCRTAHAVLNRWRDAGQAPDPIPHHNSGQAAVWQRRCLDHNCRTYETVLEKLSYCHENPVKRGLVKRPEDWPWSSCRWYLGDRDVVLEIDGLEW